MRKAKKSPIHCVSGIVRLFLLFLLSIVVFGCGGQENEQSFSNGQVKQTGGKDRADEIITEFLKRDAAPYRKVRVRFTITSESDPTKIYELDTWRRQTENQTTTLTQIIKPAEDSDLASLMVETKGQPTVVTTYSATLKDFRETDTNKMFFGGITAGELLGEWSKFDFRLTKTSTDTIHGDSVELNFLEGALKKGESGTVARMVVWMRADNYVPVHIQIFDSSDKQIRAFDTLETNTDDHSTYASKIEVANPIYKTTTVIEVLGREFPEHLEDGLFTKDRLKAIATKQKPA